MLVREDMYQFLRAPHVTIKWIINVFYLSAHIISQNYHPHTKFGSVATITYYNLRIPRDIRVLSLYKHILKH